MRKLREVVHFQVPFLVACFGLLLSTPASAEGPLRYAGATTLQRDFMPEAAAIFTKSTGVNVTISGGNTDAGLQALQAGTVDIAGAGRALNSTEKAAGLREHQIGWDPLIFVVHRSNPVGSLSRDQLFGIFSGKIVNWKELGGRDQPLVVVIGPENSGMYSAVQELVLLGGKPTSAALITPLVADGDQQVAQLPTAICALSKSMVDQAEVKMLRVDGIEPSATEVTNGRYPLLRPLSLVTTRVPHPDTKRFVDFARGTEGQQIMAKKFYPVVPR